MVTHVIEKNNNFYCAHCRMLVKELLPYCGFCGRTISNYEDMLTKFWHLQEEDKIKESINDKN